VPVKRARTEIGDGDETATSSVAPPPSAQRQQPESPEESPIGAGTAEATCAVRGGEEGESASAAPAAQPSSNPFEEAEPTRTHMGLLALLRSDFVSYISSQNVDGLHLRSGVPRDRLSELHGNMFMERCEKCNREYFGDKDVGTVGLKLTGNACPHPDCGGSLRDSLLDWDDALPDDDYERAQRETRAADLSVCFGTSLRVHPACDLPFLCKPENGSATGGKVVIVNLQTTPFNDEADLVIHARCDAVVEGVCKALGVEIPEYDSGGGVQDLPATATNIQQSA
jgi:NAD-dependent protein deacetylase sirtuin 6